MQAIIKVISIEGFKMVWKDWEYRVEDDATYTIEVRVGDGQKGHSSFRDLNDIPRHGSEVLEFELGSGVELKNKYIRISTVCDDINHGTDRVTVSYLINGEFIEADENPLIREADEDGVAKFVTKISFIS